MHEWDQEPLEVFVVPGNYYKIEVPQAILRDRAKFEEYTAALIERRVAVGWYMYPIPAWVFLCVVALIVLVVMIIGLGAEITVPLGL